MSSLSPHISPPRISGAPGWSGRQRSRRAPGLRLRVLLQRSRLDALIAEGADVDSSEDLALRARQLTSPRERRRLAESLDEALSIAEGYARRVSSAPPLARRDIRACRAALLQLSRALRQDDVVRPAGVVRTRELLTNGNGPFYLEAPHDALWRALRHATRALESHA
jgi:hypothetical protein